MLIFLTGFRSFPLSKTRPLLTAPLALLGNSSLQRQRREEGTRAALLVASFCQLLRAWCLLLSQRRRIAEVLPAPCPLHSTPALCSLRSTEPQLCHTAQVAPRAWDRQGDRARARCRAIPETAPPRSHPFLPRIFPGASWQICSTSLQLRTWIPDKRHRYETRRPGLCAIYSRIQTRS